MTTTFHAPRSFHPAYSLLGRTARAWTGNRLQGEALFIVSLTGLALALLMSHYLGWALLQPTLAADPALQTYFWAGQVALVAVLSSVGLVGFCPELTITCGSTALEIEQGAVSETVRYDEIETVESISATTYHRHYRRYAATRIFQSQLVDEMVLLRTTSGPLVIALPDPNDRKALRAHLMTVDLDVAEPVPQPQS